MVQTEAVTTDGDGAAADAATATAVGVRKPFQQHYASQKLISVVLLLMVIPWVVIVAVG